MQYILFFLISISTFLEAAPEFQFIKPISVESSHIKVTTPSQTITQQAQTAESQMQEVRLLDSDKDGIVDTKDTCPDTQENFIVDNHGCPQIPALNIKFESKQYDINDEVLDAVEDLSNFLKEHTNYQVVIYGYTDSIGDEVDNQILSQKRADTVKEALIFHGISSTKLTAIGKGEENPIADNMSAQGREKNRRITIELIQ